MHLSVAVRASSDLLLIDLIEIHTEFTKQVMARKWLSGADFGHGQPHFRVQNCTLDEFS
jgi:hypothetical protein